MRLLLNRDDVNVVAICDINDQMLQSAKNSITKSGKKAAQIFTGSNDAYKKLLELKNLDAIIIATPWEWHTPMILDAINAGIKYIGTEVVLGITLEDHWSVVRAAEKANAHVSMLENVCYRRDVMAALNMVREGLFGEILHLQGGYQHDLRQVKFTDAKHRRSRNLVPKPFPKHNGVPTIVYTETETSILLMESVLFR